MKKYQYLLLILILSSCAKPQDDALKASFKIQLPAFKHNSHSIKNLRKEKASSFGQGLLTDITQINCFAVLISKAGTGACYSETDNSILANASLVYGSVAGGGIIAVNDVPSGEGQQISVIGLYSATTCPNFVNLSFSNLSQLSAPMIISQKIVDLTPGDQEVVMPIAIDTTMNISTCKGGPFGWSLGGLFDSAIWDDAVWAP